MAKQELNKKLKNLAKPASTEALETSKWRRENRNWLKRSFEISLGVLEAIKKKGWNQEQLAEAMGASQQQLSKVVKGKENFTLQTIAVLEKVLETKLIHISIKND